jgi:hypothetical protein
MGIEYRAKCRPDGRWIDLLCTSVASDSRFVLVAPLTDAAFDATRANLLSAGSTPTTLVYADWFDGAAGLALRVKDP